MDVFRKLDHMDSITWRQALELPCGETTIVTVNDRLRRYLAQQLPEPVWSGTLPLTFGQWVQHWCQNNLRRGHIPTSEYPRRILSQQQCRWLWEEIISDCEAEYLLNEQAAAKNAYQAWNLLKQWQVEPLSQTHSTREFERLIMWGRRFDEKLQTLSATDNTGLMELMQRWLALENTLIPRHLVVAGFDDFSPLQRALFDKLQVRGCQILQLESSHQETAHVERTACPSAGDEIRQAAMWAKAQSGQLIGIVFPQLESQRDEIERQFRQILSPEACLPGQHRGPAPFNISGGRPLLRYALTDNALLVLKLFKRFDHFASTDISRLLLAPYWADGSDSLSSRAMLDATLRKSRLIEYPARLLLDKFQSQPVLYQYLNQAITLRGTMPSHASARQWVNHFTNLLEQSGWPGHRPLDSEEYQTRTRFLETLAQLSELDIIRQRWSYGEALSHLTRLCREALFQPQQKQAARIQIMGTLEAAGQHFDALWIAGLDADSWPPAPSPNPFLPVSLQRKLDMPHSSAERERQYSQQVLNRLLGSSPQIMLSHVSQQQDQPLAPSPMIAHIPEVKPQIIAQALQSNALESVDDAAPPLAEGEIVSGGTRLLADQALCPQLAFVHFRLHGNKILESPLLAPDAATRGTLVHSALEYFWRRTRNQGTLLAYSDEAFHQLCKEAAHFALSNLEKDSPGLMGEHFRKLEQKRLIRLIEACCDIDRQRPPFEVVACEQDATIDLGHMKIRVKLDRIDRVVEDQALVIIDYKSTSPSLALWRGERLGEPQLPLYATYSHERPAAVAFLQVKSGECKFTGLSKQENMLPAIKALEKTSGFKDYSDWDGLLDEWQDKIHLLAEEIRLGDARLVYRPQDRSKLLGSNGGLFLRLGDDAALAEAEE